MGNRQSVMGPLVPHCAFFLFFFLASRLAATFLKGLAGDLRECTPSYFVIGCSLKFLWVDVCMLQVNFDEVLAEIFKLEKQSLMYVHYYITRMSG